MLPGRSRELFIPGWAEGHFPELAHHRIALLAECLPYSSQMLIDGLRVF